MTPEQREILAEKLTKCYKCNKEIDKTEVYYIREFYNSELNKMDVRLECFPSSLRHIDRSIEKWIQIKHLKIKFIEFS